MICEIIYGSPRKIEKLYNLFGYIYYRIKRIIYIASFGNITIGGNYISMVDVLVIRSDRFLCDKKLNFLLLLTLNQESPVNAMFYGNPKAK